MRLLGKSHLILYIMLGVLYSLIVWTIKPQEPAVFFLVILSVLMVVTRLRFFKYTEFFYVEIIVFIGMSWFYNETVYLLIPAITIWIYKGKIWMISLYVIIWVGLTSLAFEFFVIGLFSSVIGVMLYFIDKDNVSMIKAVDHLREEKYVFEKERYELIKMQEEISHLSMISERERIAQKLHDDLGHELTGALLALRAFETNNAQALEDSSFIALKHKVEKSVENLKETVHHTKPEIVYSLEQFRKNVHSFTLCEVKYTQKGLVNALRPIHWQAFLSVLKEAYTNIQKHANPKLVEVSLYVDERIAKLMIQNDYPIDRGSKKGVGLHFMRRRIEGLGGNLSVNRSHLFTLTCLIPIEVEGL